MAVTTMAGSPRRRHLVEAGPGAGDAAAVAYDYARGHITVMLLTAIPAPLAPPVQPIMILQLLLTPRMPDAPKIVVATTLDVNVLVMMHTAFVLIVMTWLLILMVMFMEALLTLTILVAILLFLHGFRNLITVA